MWFLQVLFTVKARFTRCYCRGRRNKCKWIQSFEERYRSSSVAALCKLYWTRLNYAEYLKHPIQMCIILVYCVSLQHRSVYRNFHEIPNLRCHITDRRKFHIAYLYTYIWKRTCLWIDQVKPTRNAEHAFALYINALLVLQFTDLPFFPAYSSVRNV